MTLQKLQNNAVTRKTDKDAIAMMNALQGAKQQCESFLQEFNNDESDTNSDSSDVG